MEAGEGDKVHRQLAQVCVQLTREAQTARDAGHDHGDEVVEVTERGGSELECTEADVVQRFVIQDHAFVGVFDELVNGQGGVVGLHHRIRHLRRGDHREGKHHAVGVLLADFGDEESTHTGAGAASKGVGDLETYGGRVSRS